MHFTAELPDALVAQALELAYRSSISSWSRATQIFPAPIGALTDVLDKEKHPFYYPLRGGKWIITETQSQSRFPLNGRALAEGARIVAASYPSVLVPLLGHDRPVTGLEGDALIQCALFGTWRHKPHDRETLKPT